MAELTRLLLDLFGSEVVILEEAVEVFRGALALLPLPTLEEVAEMRAGKRPLTTEAYLAGVLQRCMVDLENVVSDIQDSTKKSVLRKVAKLRLSEMEYNEIKAAVKSLTS
jgi:hypothetical protein